MSKIEELIKEYCPNGVEYKELGEICKISRGRVISKEYLLDNIGEYPVYSSQTINEGILGKIDTYDYEGEYLTWTTDGANAGSVFYRVGRFSVTNVCGLLEVVLNCMNIKYLYYYLEIVAKKHVNAGMGNPKLMSNVISKIEIPIPPIAIQEEIVNILDNFTELEAELEAELVLREKQYHYYRDKLLDFGTEQDNIVPWIALYECCDVNTGVQLNKDNLYSDGKYPVMNGGIYPSGRYDEYNTEKDNITISQGGASAGYVNWIKEPFWSGAHCYTVIPNNNRVNKKFIYYILKKHQQYFIDSQYGAGIPSLNRKKILDFKVPVPPLSEQERIVNILDKFDSLLNDISIGLPAEINARQQQYKYYRNKLLSFKHGV